MPEPAAEIRGFIDPRIRDSWMRDSRIRDSGSVIRD